MFKRLTVLACLMGTLFATVPADAQGYYGGGYYRHHYYHHHYYHRHHYRRPFDGPRY